MGELEHYATNVSDYQWELLEPLLPVPKKQPGGSGRPPRDLREVLNGRLLLDSRLMLEQEDCAL